MLTTFSPPRADRLLSWALRLAGAMAVLVLGGIVLVLLIQSAPFLFDHGSGLWRNDWQPGQARYGMPAPSW